MENLEYRKITKEKLTRFQVVKEGEKYSLSFSNCKNKILVKLPFVLNEKVATLAGMMPDGSLIKDLRRIYFSQKKDYNKNLLFRDLILELFSPNNKVFIRWEHNVYETYTNSTVLAHFLHHILDFKKSDEKIRIPLWVFNSPYPVKRAYLREAFAMEGTIFGSLKEIRLISKHQEYALDIKNLLSSLHINSFVKERIAGTPKTIQYRVSIYRKENFEKFKLIGFTVPLHVQRFDLICKKYGI